jgi:hypothetical protein
MTDEYIVVQTSDTSTATNTNESIISTESFIVSPVVSTGAQGPQGRQGATGSIGPQGATGVGLQGIQGIQGATGIKGDTGQGFTIAKTYSSVAALISDTSPSGVVAGSLALIDTGDNTNPENNRLYIWTGTAYNFLSDLGDAQSVIGPPGSTGIQGIQGATGPQGIQGIQGVQGIPGNQGSTGFRGYMGATGQGATGSSGIRGIQGATGPQGIQGIQGATGPQGIRGLQGATGYQGATGLSLISEATDVDNSQLTDGSVLVYDDTSTKWKTTKILDSQAVDCGLF